MENSYRFFENKDCKYFPCHSGLEDFNCLNYKWIEVDGKKIKDCMGCSFPHQPENYEIIMEFLKRK